LFFSYHILLHCKRSRSSAFSPSSSSSELRARQHIYAHFVVPTANASCCSEDRSHSWSNISTFLFHLPEMSSDMSSSVVEPVFSSKVFIL
ncbi:hypothetical protein H5410_032429, partial [Solanum commersonii]